MTKTKVINNNNNNIKSSNGKYILKTSRQCQYVP